LTVGLAASNLGELEGPLINVITIDRVVRGTVEETLNALLDAEADLPTKRKPWCQVNATSNSKVVKKAAGYANAVVCPCRGRLGPRQNFRRTRLIGRQASPPLILPLL
jgi:hypothetical protein